MTTAFSKKHTNSRAPIRVRFYNLQSIVSFVNIIEEESARAEVISPRMRMDARSLLGLVNLGFDESYDLVLYEDDAKKNQILQRLDEYIVH